MAIKRTNSIGGALRGTNWQATLGVGEPVRRVEDVDKSDSNESSTEKEPSRRQASGPAAVVDLSSEARELMEAGDVNDPLDDIERYLQGMKDNSRWAAPFERDPMLAAFAEEAALKQRASELEEAMTRQALIAPASNDMAQRAQEMRAEAMQAVRPDESDLAVANYAAQLEMAALDQTFFDDDER